VVVKKYRIHRRVVVCLGLMLQHYQAQARNCNYCTNSETKKQSKLFSVLSAPVARRLTGVLPEIDTFRRASI